MPYKFETDKLKISKADDRRIKLSAEEKEQIKEQYGKVSQRKLAKAFGVSRRTIIFIGCPEKYQKNLKSREERGGSAIYYDKKRHAEAMKKHRRHKKELQDNGRLEGEKNEA